MYGTQLPQGGSPATTASQIYPINGGTATDVYVNTNDLKHFSQGTILHEALHNLTGFYDSTTATTQGLEEHLGLDPNKDCPNGSVCITSKLQQSGCAGTQ